MPDLKKMLTLEALSEALPSWLKRSTKPEYNADEIDSTLTTNQFVSASDKDNWNAKGTYSKPSGGIPKSDLSSIVQTSLEKADSALQSETDPTVPTWAKQTNKPSYTQDEVADGSTYKRVTQTEKDGWSGKQNALTTTQMQAVNSGITSDKVTQISTNQTNILYNLNVGAKNVAAIDNAVYKAGSTDRYLEIPCGNLSGWIHIHLDSITSDDTNATTCGYILVYTNGQTSNLGQFDRGVVINKDINIENLKIKSIYIYPSNNYTNSEGDTFTLTNFAVVSKTIWDQYPTFTPASLPNHDLTVLEAEDRASLAEVVDSGAKNILDEWAEVAKRYDATGNTIERNGITYTYSNGSITISGTATAKENFFLLQDTMLLSNGNYVVSWRSKTINAITTNIKYLNMSYAIVSADSVIELPANRTDSASLWLTIPNGTTVSGTIDIMVATKAAFGVSKAFVPYRPNYDLVAKAVNTVNKIALDTSNTYTVDINSITYTSYMVIKSNSTNFPSGVTGQYSFLRTDAFDGSTGRQELTLSDSSDVYVRTRSGQTWHEWKKLN